MISLEQATNFAKARPDIAAGLVEVVRAGIDVRIYSMITNYTAQLVTPRIVALLPEPARHVTPNIKRATVSLASVRPEAHPFIDSQNARRQLRQQQPGIWV